MKFVIYSTQEQSWLTIEGKIGNWNTTADEVKTFDSKQEAEQFIEGKKWFSPDLLITEIKYAVCSKEIGEEIEHFETFEDALKEIEKFEDEDKSNYVYQPDFYEITIIGI